MWGWLFLIVPALSVWCTVVLLRRGNTGTIDHEVGGVAEQAKTASDAIMYRNSGGPGPL